MFEIVSPRQMTLRPVMPGGRSCAMRCGPTSGPWAAVRSLATLSTPAYGEYVQCALYMCT